MPSPYISPAVLRAHPTGVSWNQIPSKDATPQQNTAELVNICWAATHEVDAFVNQNLRASLTSERLLGPDYYLTIPQGAFGPARLHVSRFPVVRVMGGQISPAQSFPPQWTTLAASQFQLDYSIIGDVSTDPMINAAGAGPAAVLVAPGYISWAGGRRGMRLQVDYISGWRMSGITSQAIAGATSLQVDDVIGWDQLSENTNQFPLATIFDDDLSEDVQVSTAVATNPIVTSSGVTVQAGPGTLTLRPPGLQYTHNRMTGVSPTLITCMPDSVIWGTTLLAASMALTRGATASTMPAMPGSSSSSGSAAKTALVARAQELLRPYRRPL